MSQQKYQTQTILYYCNNYFFLRQILKHKKSISSNYHITTSYNLSYTSINSTSKPIIIIFTPSSQNILQRNIIIKNNKYDTAYQLYRHMYGSIHMWKKYIQTQEETRILLSILSKQRSSKQSVKLFLKIRKQILKNTNNLKVMQEISLSHCMPIFYKEDIVTISHSIFSKDMKSFVAKKIHELFISIKKKSLNSNNKINGAAVCQFFMNCAQKFQKQQLNNIRQYYDKAPQQQKIIQQQIIKKRVFKPLNQQCNMQYAQNLNKPQYLDEPIQKQQAINHISQLQNKKLKNKQSHQQFIINSIYDHRSIQNYDRHDNINNRQNVLENAKEIVNRKYSYSWQKFLKTNRQMKQKLLNGH